jgi:pimeloyl-ACP methyl ester carboxylesterase
MTTESHVATSTAATLAVPAWFERALTHVPEEQTVEVDGCLIHFLAWGESGRPGIVLIHGGAAHAHWWSFLAPLLLPQHRIVALDLSGHGDSGRREIYPRAQWAKEVVAVAAAAAFGGPPVLVGHSMGGLVAIAAASQFGDRFAGAIIVDSPVRRPDPESTEGQRGRSFKNPKTYPTLEEALSHFRLVPEQPCDNPYILDYIARHSLRQVEAGWTWKFDPMIFRNASPEPMSDLLRSVRLRVALLRGQYSRVVNPETGEYMVELLDRSAPLVEIPEAHHHLLLDQPLAFIAALRALLADWEHSVPSRAR